MSICYVCGCDNPDQSDKEMFDAQMISGLKDRVKELEDGLRKIISYYEDGDPCDFYIIAKALLLKEKI